MAVINPGEGSSSSKRARARLCFLGGVGLALVIIVILTGSLDDAFLAFADFTLRHGS